MGIVCRKLRVDLVACIKCGSRRSEVGNIRMRFAREHRIALEALLLRPFHFAVPISALDEAYRDTSTDVAGQLDQEAHRVAPATLVGLQCNAETFPAV